MKRLGPTGMDYDGLYFQDSPEKKLIDYVIVSNLSDSAEHADDDNSKREIFLQNLQDEGLEVESHHFSDNVVFYKIHAPLQVLKKYGELLKIKMPIKRKYCNARKLSAEISIEGTDMLEQEMTLHELPEPPSFYTTYILKFEV